MVSSVPGFDLSHLNSPASIDSHIKTPLQSETDPTATRERSVAMVLQLEGSRIPTGGSSGVIKHEPKDHLAENVRRMRHIQRESRKKQGGVNEPVKGLWKSTKYEGVTSKVKNELIKQENAPRPQSANSFLRAHSRTGGVMSPAPRPSSARQAPVAPRAAGPARPHSARPASATDEARKPSVPKANCADDINIKRKDFNFIKINGMAARHSTMKRSPSLTALDDYKKKQHDEECNYRKGQVPKYLQSRQKQWQRDEEERIAAIPDPELPPGHRVMPNNDRIAMLQKLQTSQQTLNQQLASLPVRTDTLRIRTQKEAIEGKLAEVEGAITIFSRSKVFVKEDS